ncbi:hypothetical protein DFJ77DRAFT_217295 [Powellomyces hirtus]|nr:hypothetical protein DFJ77DRAFT_217295 [Powellomyces hirtus]
MDTLNSDGKTYYQAYQEWEARNRKLREVGERVSKGEVPNAVVKTVSVSNQSISPSTWGKPAPVNVETGPDGTTTGPQAETKQGRYQLNPLDEFDTTQALADATLDARFNLEGLGSAGLRTLSEYAAYPPPEFGFFVADGPARECQSSGRIVDDYFYVEAQKNRPAVLNGIINHCPNKNLGLNYVMLRTGPACEEKIVESWTAVDQCQHDSSRSRTIILKDETPPIFNSPPPAAVTDQCHSIRPMAVLTATDICYPDEVGPVQYATVDPVTAGCKRRVITYTWTVDDVCGNRQTYSQLVTVQDNDPPTWDEALFPADVDVEFMTPYGADVTGYPVATDRCASNPIKITYADVVTVPPAGSRATLIITRTFTATDACGNPTSRAQIISIVQTQRSLGTTGHYALVVRSSSGLDAAVVEGQIIAGKDIRATYSVFGNGTCGFHPAALVVNGSLAITDSAILQGSALVSGPVQSTNMVPYVLTKTTTDEEYMRNTDINLATAWTVADHFRDRVLSLGNLHLGPLEESCHIPVPGAPVNANSPGCGIITSISDPDRFDAKLEETELKLTGTNAVYNIFAVNVKQLSAASTISVNVPSTAYVFINIIPDPAGPTPSLTWNKKTSLPSGLNAKNVLWVFHTLATVRDSGSSTTSLRLVSTDFLGSILGLDLDVMLDSPSSITGFLWSQTLQGVGFRQKCGIWQGSALLTDRATAGAGVINLDELLPQKRTITSSAATVTPTTLPDTKAGVLCTSANHGAWICAPERFRCVNLVWIADPCAGDLVCGAGGACVQNTPLTEPAQLACGVTNNYEWACNPDRARCVNGAWANSPCPAGTVCSAGTCVYPSAVVPTPAAAPSSTNAAGYVCGPGNNNAWECTPNR